MGINTEKTQKYEIGKDFSGRPEGVSDAEWNKILESARNQVIAERSGNEKKPIQIVENNSDEPNLASVPKNLGSGSEQIITSQISETQGSVEEFRKQILQRALDILNGSHSSAGDLKVNKPDDVYNFVERLTSVN